jgi:hypothetical protein
MPSPLWASNVPKSCRTTSAGGVTRSLTIPIRAIIDAPDIAAEPSKDESRQDDGVTDVIEKGIGHDAGAHLRR